MTRHTWIAMPLLALAGCLPDGSGGGDIASGGSGGTPRSISAGEKQQGSQAHPQLLAEFGGLYAGPQAAYVTTVGRRIAVQSGLSNSQNDFTISLLNSPVNNAFAIPGGYVYATRQLLALMNDEAELASVLGHEVGHVAARHSSRRQTTSTITSVLAAGLGLLTGSSQLGEIAGYGAQLYTLKFSRDQEYEADDLGIRYLAGAGYDPQAAASMLASLNAQSTLDARLTGQAAGSVPSWASTHPNTADRVARARQRATATGSAATQRNREGFLAALDGVLYGDDPAQGVVDGRSFRHPALRLAFTAPAGFALVNGTDAVTIAGNGGQAQFAGGKLGAGGLSAHIAAVFKAVGGDTAISYGEPRAATVNGIEAATATATVTASSGPVDVTVFAYRWDANTAYHFLTITPGGKGLGPFAPLVNSLARLSPEQAAAIRARRIDVVTVAPGDTVAALAQRMAYTDAQVERFRVLNGLDSGATLRAGQKVKLVVFAR